MYTYVFVVYVNRKDIYIYICMCVHIFMYGHMPLYICMCIYVYTYMER